MGAELTAAADGSTNPFARLPQPFHPVPSRALLIEHRGIVMDPGSMISILLQDHKDPGRCFMTGFVKQERRNADVDSVALAEGQLVPYMNQHGRQLFWWD